MLFEVAVYQVDCHYDAVRSNEPRFVNYGVEAMQ
jgi:hypothetical protein